MFDFTGYGENVLTFKTEETNLKGYPVNVISDSCVGIAGKDSDFCGIALAVRGGAATVLMSGYVEMPFSGDAPSYGSAYIAADGNGGVSAAADGKKVTIVKIDTEKATVGFIF